MTEKSRTENSARNASIAMVSQIIAIIMGYVTRVVFTHTLSESYVGINGLFMDILNVLALSQLGVGAALTYALYKPIAEGNIEKQKSLMQLFKWMYRIMALLIAVAGLLVVPFLGRLVHDAYDVGNIVPIYLLYLLNTVVSYLIVYKKNLVDAHQLSYIGVLCQTIFLLIQYVGQIVILLYTHNFILFLLIYLLCTLGNNVSIAKKADSLYPYLRDKEVEPIPKAEKREIIKNIRAMLMHKIGTVVVNNTDNLLISAMVGIVSVGKYSNYYLIIGSIRQVLEQIFQGITASVGNFGVTENKERIKNIFEASFFIGQWICGFCAICLFQLLNGFVALSFGENYVFPLTLVFVLCLNFFITGMRQATLVFRDSMGLFWYDRYKSLVEAVINLVASILLTLRFGIIGVFLGTFISTMLTSFWIEPYVLYSKKLESPVAPYFLRYAVYTAVVGAAGILTHFACRQFDGAGIPALCIRLMLCVIIPNALFLLCYHRTKEFGFLWQKAIGLLKKKLCKESEANEEALEPMDEKLLEIVKVTMTGENSAQCWELSGDEWDEILEKADRHAVLSILYDTLTKQKLSPDRQERVARASRKYVVQNYRLLYSTHKTIEALKKNGIQSVVLKGVSIACCYPTPELRKSGDVDILLMHENQLIAAKDAMREIGFAEIDEQQALHHLAMVDEVGIETELHTMLAEPFDNSYINKYIADLLSRIPEHTEEREIMGYDFPVLSDGFQAYSLLLHMLQHFLRAGFGLKLLCDWVVFWQREVSEEEIRLYLSLAQESGLSGFSDMITSVCVIYLGLDKNCCLCRNMNGQLNEADALKFMKDFMEAEEFGRSSNDRMVALRGTSLFDLVREFHHMTCLNFPKMTKVFLLWPVLWMMTLLRFLRNNRKVRGVSTADILKKAKSRSTRIERLELFKTQADKRK